MRIEGYLSKLIDDNNRKVWYSNINWEQKQRSGFIPQFSNSVADRIVCQMDSYQLLLADPFDDVILSTRPDDAFLQYLNWQGFSNPKLCIGKRDQFEERFEGVKAIPFLMDTDEELFLNSKGCEILGPSPSLSLLLNHKVQTRELCVENGFTVTDGMTCNGIEFLENAFRELSASNPGGRFVVKTPYGSAGKGLFHIHSPNDFRFLLTFINRQKQKQEFSCTIERWHDIAHCLNAQLFIWDGQCHILAITSQQIDSRGVYRGSDLLPAFGDELEARYREELFRLGKMLIGMGYRGFLGVDSIVDRLGLLIPIIEINARLTMVTYLLAIREHLITQGVQNVCADFHDFRSKKFIDFTNVSERLDRGTRNVLNASGYLICGFHYANDESTGVYSYRLLLLSWAENKQSLDQLKRDIQRTVSAI